MITSITCPNCAMTSHDPNDVKFRWCGNCCQFTYAFEDPAAIAFNGIVGDLQKHLRIFLTDGPLFSLQFEQFTGTDGTMKWRALIKTGSQVWKHSAREQTTPCDALRELHEIVQASARPAS